MEIEYGDPNLRCLAEDPTFCRPNWDRQTVVAYRKKIQCIRSAVDERDLRGARSLRLQELAGAGAWTIRLSDRLLLNLTLRTGSSGQVTAALNLADHDRRETSR